MDHARTNDPSVITRLIMRKDLRRNLLKHWDKKCGKNIVAIQKDNAANILGALGADCVDYFYYCNMYFQEKINIF